MGFEQEIDRLTRTVGELQREIASSKKELEAMKKALAKAVDIASEARHRTQSFTSEVHDTSEAYKLAAQKQAAAIIEERISEHFAKARAEGERAAKGRNQRLKMQLTTAVAIIAALIPVLTFALDRIFPKSEPAAVHTKEVP